LLGDHWKSNCLNKTDSLNIGMYMKDKTEIKRKNNIKLKFVILDKIFI